MRRILLAGDGLSGSTPPHQFDSDDWNQRFHRLRKIRIATTRNVVYPRNRHLGSVHFSAIERAISQARVGLIRFVCLDSEGTL
jgi:hypothetical protein